METKTYDRLKKLVNRTLLMVLLIAAFTVNTPKAQAAVTANERATFEYLTSSMGLNPAAACGIMGSIKAESSFISDIRGLGGAYGICQWMGVRITRLQSYCAQHGLDYTSLKGQLSYLNYETRTTFPSVYSYLKSVSNTAEGAYNAGYHWCYNFEIPADRHGASAYRASIARDVYWKEFGNGALYLKTAEIGGTVKLNWTGSSANGFAIRRSTSATSGYTTIAKTAAGVKSFEDKTAQPGRKYYYFVRAINKDGSLGAKSNACNLLVKASLKDAACTITLKPSSYVYNGKAKKPVVTVKWNGNLLKRNTNYTVSYKNNVNAGKATVTITGKGNYKGSVTKTFVIKKAPQKISAQGKILNITGKGFAYKCSAKGKVSLVSRNTNVFSVKGHTIYAKKAGRVQMIVKAAATANYAATQKTVWIRVKPATPTVTASNPSASAIKAVWKAAGTADGYSVRYMDTSTSKMKVVTVDSGKVKTTMLNDLKKGKTYTVRVRSYTMSGETKIWSAWSKPVKVKIAR